MEAVFKRIPPAPALVVKWNNIDLVSLYFGFDSRPRHFMYSRLCPECSLDYTDSENKLSVALFGACLLCRLEDSRWENEGGILLTHRPDL